MLGVLMARRKIRRSVKALNRRELASYMDGWAEDGVMQFPGAIPGVSGTHVGKAAVRAFFQRMFEQFPVIRFISRHVLVQNPMALGSNVIAMQWDLEVVNREGLEGRNSGVTMATIRRGKVVHLQDFIFDTGDRFHAAWGAGNVTAVAEPEVIPAG